MEIIIVIFTIILFVFLNSLTYILGALRTVPGDVFLGTVHWTGDYFSYLSQFAQGRDNWAFNLDLYTHEFTTRTLVGWINVFLGHIFHLIGIDHLTAYQLSIAIFAFLFLFISYLLIREIFPEDLKRKNRISKSFVAFLLFITSSAFPKLVMENGNITLSYFDYWFNNGVPFNRLGGVPHHLVSRAAVSLIILLVLWWWKRLDCQKAGMQESKGGRYGWKYFIIILSLPVLGFVLASAEPVHWMETVVILFVTITLYKFILPFTGYLRHKFQLTTTYYFLPSILLFFGGIPMVLYLKKITSFLPYSQLAVWEASQQLHIDFFTFLLGNGPVFILAVFGCLLFIKNITLPRATAIVFTAVTTALYLSSIPQMLKIVNVRFLPAATTIFFACMAAEAIFAIAQKLKNVRNLTIIAITGLIIMIHIPVIYLQLQSRIAGIITDSNNAFFYVPQKVIDAYKTAEKESTTKDTFLVIWPFNWTFPGITGRRVFYGHTLATIDYPSKEKAAIDFFDGRMRKEEMESFLKSNKITYVLAYSWTKSVKGLNPLAKIYDNNYMVLYKVKR